MLIFCCWNPLKYLQDAANDQHYEVPPEYYQLCLGPWFKYSSCLYSEGAKTLQEAEEAMLNRVCKTACIDKSTWADSELKEDKANQRRLRVLDLGCGWGSFSLYVASKYPYCDV
jgi:cyclopropane fatty-acyl-phospholipid synthase-like methyltransferase